MGSGGGGLGGAATGAALADVPRWSRSAGPPAGCAAGRAPLDAEPLRAAPAAGSRAEPRAGPRAELHARPRLSRVPARRAARWRRRVYSADCVAPAHGPAVVGGALILAGGVRPGDSRRLVGVRARVTLPARQSALSSALTLSIDGGSQSDSGTSFDGVPASIIASDATSAIRRRRPERRRLLDHLGRLDRSVTTATASPSFGVTNLTPIVSARWPGTARRSGSAPPVPPR